MNSVTPTLDMMPTNLVGAPQLVVDRNEIERFVNALFRYAEPGLFVSYRAFDQFDRKKPPILIEGIPINENIASMVPRAAELAQRCADSSEPVVFAPPICAFSNPHRARGVDLAAGLVLSVELDDGDPDVALATLEGLLGLATVVVHSGSAWSDAATGEVKPKIHAHWRLKKPTTTAEDHARLRQARDLAARLVGADPTGKPIVHPLRWPGSWNCKGTPARMARIARLNETEIDLNDAVERLGVAIEVSDMGETDAGGGARGPQAPIEKVISAMASVPNNTDIHYDMWVKLGYAMHHATGGAVAGFDAWDAWSRKSSKYDAAETEVVWKRITSAVNGTEAKIGARTIFWHAIRAGWRAGQDKAESGSDPVSIMVGEFNARFYVVREGGKTVIHEPFHDNELNRERFDRMTFEDFRQFFSNRVVQTGTDSTGRPVIKPLAPIWLNHPMRRQYSRIVFDPSGRTVPGDVLNLWRGFAVEPKAGSWALMREHILKVICGGVEAYDAYLMGWLARLVQFPAERGEVAVVLRGGQGAGKGTFASAIQHLFGQHGLHISDPNHLVGHFNGHLRDCVFMLADEAFFAGDPRHLGALNRLITETSHMIEAKYQNPVASPNYLHVIMASNEKWVVPAALDSRRYFCLDVTSDRVGDHAYFAAIQAELRSGGYEAMLFDLLAYDLTGFNHREVPVTEALQDQRRQTLPTAEAWWLDVLHRGYVYKSKLGLDAYFGEWHEKVATAVLYQSYIDYAAQRRERRPMEPETFGRFMRNTVEATPLRLRNVVIGERREGVDAYNTVKPRAPGYRLGCIDEARDAFTKVTGLNIAWENPEDDEDAGNTEDSIEAAMESVGASMKTPSKPKPKVPPKTTGRKFTRP